jgi:hypothetical protein
LEVFDFSDDESEMESLNPSLISFCKNDKKPQDLKIKLPNNLVVPKEENLKKNNFSIGELKNAFCFIKNNVHLSLPGAEEAFRELTPNARTFIKMYLVFNLDQLPSNLKFITLSGKFHKKKKRKEEMNKNLYKQALKKFRAQFRRVHFNLHAQTEDPELKKKFQNKKVGFWIWMFMETITNKRENTDFILDVCFEKYGSKRNELFPREKGWRENTDYKAMKNISATFRYLVRSDEPCRRKFLDFFQSREEGGFYKEYERKILRTLEEKLKSFQKVLNSVGNEFDSFMSEIRVIMADKMYKSPWMMYHLESSISHCMNELECDYSDPSQMAKCRNLANDYQKMKQVHYSQH